MAHFEEPFTPEEIDQQLEQPFSKAQERRSQAQMLAELHIFHRAAADAEQQSIAAVWQRIEHQRRVRQEWLPEQQPIPLRQKQLRVNMPAINAHPRQKWGVATLVAILLICLLAGGVALVRTRTTAVSSPVPTATPRTFTPTPTPAARAIYTENDPSGVMKLAWSPDSQRLLYAGYNALIWDATTGQHRIIYHPLYNKPDKINQTPIQNAAWAPDQSQRVAIADGTTVRIIDGRSGKVLLTGPKQTALSTTDVQPLSYLSQGTAGVQPLSYLSQGMPVVRALAWSPDGSKIASSITTLSGGTDPRTITIWDSHTGAVLKQLTGHKDDIYQLAWSPDGKYLVSLAQSQDNTIRLWTLATGTSVELLHPAGYGVVERLAWSPNGKYLAIQAQMQVGNNTLGTIITRDEIQILQVQTLKIITHYTRDIHEGSGFEDFSWAPDSTRLISTVEDTTVARVWNALTGQILFTYQAEIASKVAWSPDGKYIALSGEKMIDKDTSIDVTGVWNAPPAAWSD